MHKILYDVKNTSATTTYMSISKTDLDYLQSQIISIQSYMSELSLCTNQDVKDLLKWYQKPSKTLPFHSKWKRNNSPQSFIAGTLNNLMYNGQQDLSQVQAEHLQNIINNFVALMDALREMKIDLQKNNVMDTIMFTENLWEVTTK